METQRLALKTNASEELDRRFGVPIAPKRVDPIEKNVVPRSLQQLDQENAKLLLALVSATVDGLGVTQFVYCEAPILWIVDELGRIWFAVEEIITSGGDFVMPRLRGITPAEYGEKLGHPALIGGGSGRIGGEILFDVNLQPPQWTITNGSGRYGVALSRTLAHLESAAAEFGKFGIALKPIFYGGDE